MKKFLLFGMMGAFALTFNACSSDETVEVNPTFDGEAVKTAFTISVGNVTPNTRMTADAAQADEAFNGMQDIYLFPAKATITNATTFTEGVINLPNFNNFDANLTGANGKRYTNVTFSVGVSDFLFYAATSDASKGNGELNANYLTTPVTTASTPAGLHFDLVPYQDGKGLSDVKTAGASTLAPLTAVYAALGTQAAAAEAASQAAVANALKEMQKKLRNPNPYNATTETAWYVYAGSSASMQFLMEDLTNSLKHMNNTYGDAVLTVIANYFDIGGDNTNGWTATWTTDPDFPGSMNLPDGAVAIQWDNTNSTFDFVEANVDGVLSPAIGEYTHPAKIFYTINTKGMVSDATHLSDYTTADTWDQINNTAATGAKNHYTEGAVKNSTQSVIMKDQVQYAVGRFDAKVRVKPSAIIKDAGSGIDGAADKDPQPVVVPAAGFQLTGILVGGQNQVGWNFVPAAAGSKVIYDDVVVDDAGADIFAIQGTAYSKANSTLVLESPDATGVRIALEFTNGNNAFYGINNNLIPAGSKFYLLAQLVPGTNEKSNPNSLTQVFKQDYVTTAELTINETSLASAYNVIPDLRSPKLEFGLSVNLEWREGITFQQDF